MKDINIVTVDSKGRILIPAHIRRFLEANEGTKIMLIPDKENCELKILPLLKGKNAKIRFIVTDLPKALAKITKELSSNNIEILMSKARLLEKGQSEIEFIVDISKCNGNMSHLKKNLVETGLVKRMKITTN
ncbi:MAG: hypothetical protein DRP15_03130 [Candidatus Aenigmatarchaeota archaeon]|nr:MAG: hypothetical protein DRP15_03130 [Candidatus Aenigmarchaeota archaeon]